MNITDNNINELLDELLQLHPKKIDLSLDRIKKLLTKIENPQDKIENIIHIAGTNGKFSTLKFIQAILKANQKATNAYVSPNLVRFNERFELDDKEISNDKLYDLLTTIKKLNDDNPITFFEITSACFFQAASEIKADYTLLEVGLGGRLDSSNVISPIISVITSISHDHHEFLGETIEKIAFEKAGIIKPNIPVVIGYQPFQEAKKVLIDYASKIGAPTFVYNLDWFFTKENGNLVYEDNNHKFKFEDLNSNATFQLKNLGLAVATALQLYDIKVEPLLKNNIHQTLQFPGRFEKLDQGKLLSLINKTNELYLDSAHNTDGAANINQSLKALPPKDLCIIIGMLNTKDPQEYIKQFANITAIKTITIPGEENSISSQSLKEIIQKQFKKVDAEKSLENALKNISKENPESRILICGSVYLAGQVLKLN